MPVDRNICAHRHIELNGWCSDCDTTTRERARLREEKDRRADLLAQAGDCRNGHHSWTERGHGPCSACGEPSPPPVMPQLECGCLQGACHGGHTTRPAGPFSGEWTDAMAEEAALAMTGHPDTPICPVCECGVVDDLVYIEPVHLVPVAAHGECLPADAMLAAILAARARVTELEAANTEVLDKLQTMEEDLMDTQRGLEKMLAEERLRVQVLTDRAAQPITAETSDGYHTFTELYHYRMLYNAALFNEWATTGLYDVHKSWRHSDGELAFGGGWFVVYATIPGGQISNHYEAADWGRFQIPERETAVEWDGHTPQQAAERLAALLDSPVAQPKPTLIGYLPPVIKSGRTLAPSEHISPNETPILGGVAVWASVPPGGPGTLVGYAVAVDGGLGWFIDTVNLDGTPADADRRCHDWLSDGGYQAIVVELRKVP